MATRRLLYVGGAIQIMYEAAVKLFGAIVLLVICATFAACLWWWVG